MLILRSPQPPDKVIKDLGPAAWFRAGWGQTVTDSGVSQWDDISGNGRHLKQGTDANRPALQADGTVLFNGTSHFLKCDAFTLNQPTTVLMVVKQVSWTNVDIICDGNAAGTLYIYQVSSSPNINASSDNSVTTLGLNGGLAVGAYGVACVVFNGASSSSLINLGTPVTGSVGTGNAGGFTLGARASGSASSNIQVAEVILLPIALDATQRARAVRYLMGAWGVA